MIAKEADWKIRVRQQRKTEASGCCCGEGFPPGAMVWLPTPLSSRRKEEIPSIRSVLRIHRLFSPLHIRLKQWKREIPSEWVTASPVVCR